MASTFFQKEDYNMALDGRMSIIDVINDPNEFDVPLLTTAPSGEAEKELHLDGLRKWVGNMDEEEVNAVTQAIPIEYIVKRISQEMEAKIKMEERINKMYEDFMIRR